MGDVIEASEDGGFDIPTTSVAPSPSRLTSLPSNKEVGRIFPVCGESKKNGTENLSSSVHVGVGLIDLR